MLGARAEQVALGAQRGAERGDHGFADRVERRVRDLRELLREVVEEQARALRQYGDRGVGSHGAERLGTRSRHRREQDLHLFLGVSEGALATVDRCRRMHDVLAFGKVGEADAPLVEPVAPWRGRGEVGLDLVVFDEAPGLGVDEEHAARLQAALAHDAARLDVEHADLAREYDEPVVGDDVATGSQSVAVERGADQGTVGEDDRGRAVPRLHEHRVVLVERAPLGGDLGLVLPRLGDHHHDGVRQAAAGEGQKFDDLVERRRVARARRDDRQDRREVAEHLGLELRLACAHPVAVALDRVDLAVVRDHAERLSERPRRERVRRVPRVHERELRGEALVGEVGVERLELQRRDHALVDHRAARQRREVELEFALGALAQAEGQAVEGDALDEGTGRGGRRRLHEQLLHHGHRSAGEGAELVGAHRHLAPAEHLETLCGGEVREAALDRAARGGVDREECVADGVRTDRGQRERGDRAKEAVGNLRDDACAVTRARVGTDRTPVLEVPQRVECCGDDVVPGRAAKGRDHGQAAGVLLGAGVVQALGRGYRSEPREGWGERHRDRPHQTRLQRGTSSALQGVVGARGAAQLRRTWSGLPR